MSLCKSALEIPTSENSNDFYWDQVGLNCFFTVARCLALFRDTNLHYAVISCHVPNHRMHNLHLGVILLWRTMYQNDKRQCMQEKLWREKNRVLPGFRKWFLMREGETEHHKTSSHEMFLWDINIWSSLYFVIIYSPPVNESSFGYYCIDFSCINQTRLKIFIPHSYGQSYRFLGDFLQTHKWTIFFFLYMDQLSNILTTVWHNLLTIPFYVNSIKNTYWSHLLFKKRFHRDHKRKLLTKPFKGWCHCINVTYSEMDRIFACLCTHLPVD